VKQRDLRVVGPLTIILLQIYGLVCSKRISEIIQHQAKLCIRKLIGSSAPCTWALSCWKMKNSLGIWRMTG